MSDERPSGAFARSDAVFAILLFLLALAPRLWVAVRWTGEPVWDGHYYDFGARRIAHGLGYSDDLMVDGHPVWHAWCHYPVGYSAYLAFFYRVFGDGPLVAPVVNAVTGALLALVTWLLARSALPVWRARIAGLLVAAHPGLILYSALVMSEPLAALVTLLAFLLAVRAAGKEPGGILLGALVLGAAALVRPQALLCAPFLALLALRVDAPSGRRRAIRAGALLVVTLLLVFAPVLPWTARNCRVMDGCALVSTNAGWNLAIGAFPRATGRFETLRSSDGCREVTGQVQQDRCWLAYGLAEIRKDPRRWLGLVPKKLGYTFDHESFAVEYLREARPADWPEPRRAGARGLLSTFHRALVCIAALSCVTLWPRKKDRVMPAIGHGLEIGVQGALLLVVALLAYLPNAHGVPTFWPLVVLVAIALWIPVPGRAPVPPALKLSLALLGTTVATHAIFFGEDRYHVVVTPVLCILAASALRRPVAYAQRETVPEDAALALE